LDISREIHAGYNTCIGRTIRRKMMRMNCPHCGVGGTIADEHYLEIVKCPTCRKACRATSDVLLDLLKRSADEMIGPGDDRREIVRMNCPNCGVGGTVAAKYYQNVVSCPECTEVFRVTGGVLVDPVDHSAERAVKSDVKDQAIIVEAQHSVIDEPVVATEQFEEDTGLMDCVVCGFTFSSEFIRVIDGQQTCPVCAN
jgi:uncharacterized protein YbaR (Trm112 family)